jgi:hypothetical protein
MTSCSSKKRWAANVDSCDHPGLGNRDSVNTWTPLRHVLVSALRRSTVEDHIIARVAAAPVAGPQRAAGLEGDIASGRVAGPAG